MKPAGWLLALLAVPAAAGIIAPAPETSPRGQLWLENTTVYSRHEVVWCPAAGLAPVDGAEVAARGLFSNITVPAFGDRIRYSFYEAEAEGKLRLSRARGAAPAVAVTGFLNRYWLQAQDGLGADLAQRRTFWGPKLVAREGRGPLTATAAFRAMRVEEENRTSVTLGGGAEWEVNARWRLSAEVHPFLKNPFGWETPWGAGVEWRPEGPMSLAFEVANTYGTTTPDTFAGSRFAQYHLRLKIVPGG